MEQIVVLEYIWLDFMMAVTYCYLERENCKILKFHMNNFSNPSNKHRTSKLQN